MMDIVNKILNKIELGSGEGDEDFEPKGASPAPEPVKPGNDTNVVQPAGGNAQPIDTVLGGNTEPSAPPKVSTGNFGGTAVGNAGGDKVVNISKGSASIHGTGGYTGPHSVKDNAQNNMKVVVIQPRSLDDSQQIANCLKEKRPVVINFEGVDDQLYRRILDFVSGTTYALDGSVNSISTRVWLFSPKNVNVSVSKQTNTGFSDMPWEKK